jgi:formiminoglutamase
MSAFLQLASRQSISTLINVRLGETKLGEAIQLPDTDWENTLSQSNAAFVLLGIPEDIGVRANLGVGGAHTAWPAALKALLNIQSTAAFNGKELLLLGAFDFTQWMVSSIDQSTEALRQLTARIDEEVFPVIRAIVAAGKIPIVVGGGHNNAYPLLKGSSIALNEQVNCINLDAHCDYRVEEGRHSGNGFRYARSGGYLHRYAMVGLHENYNSHNVLRDMQADPELQFSFYEDIFLHGRQTFEQAVSQALYFAAHGKTGIELDLDCIAHVLSSAATPEGITSLQARRYVDTCARQANVAYLHLTEGATQLRDGRTDSGTGKLIAYLVSDFIKARLALPA